MKLVNWIRSVPTRWHIADIVDIVHSMRWRDCIHRHTRARTTHTFGFNQSDHHNNLKRIEQLHHTKNIYLCSNLDRVKRQKYLATAWTEYWQLLSAGIQQRNFVHPPCGVDEKNVYVQKLRTRLTMHEYEASAERNVREKKTDDDVDEKFTCHQFRLENIFFCFRLLLLASMCFGASLLE